jgi:hypothetical protein
MGVASVKIVDLELLSLAQLLHVGGWPVLVVLDSRAAEEEETDGTAIDEG